MINMPNLQRLMRPVAQKLQLLLGRAILKAVANAGLTQRLRIKLYADEEFGDVERFQEYGMETYPETEAEAVAGFLNGNRHHGIVLVVHDRRYRPLNLGEGDMMLYTRQNDKNDSTPGKGHRIWLRDNEDIQTDARNVNAWARSRHYTRAEGDVLVETPNMVINGNVTINGNLTVSPGAGDVSTPGNILATVGTVTAAANQVADYQESMEHLRKKIDVHQHPVQYLSPFAMAFPQTLPTLVPMQTTVPDAGGGGGRGCVTGFGWPDWPEMPEIPEGAFAEFGIPAIPPIPIPGGVPDIGIGVDIPIPNIFPPTLPFPNIDFELGDIPDIPIPWPPPGFPPAVWSPGAWPPVWPPVGWPCGGGISDELIKQMNEVL